MFRSLNVLVVRANVLKCADDKLAYVIVMAIARNLNELRVCRIGILSL